MALAYDTKISRKNSGILFVHYSSPEYTYVLGQEIKVGPKLKRHLE